MEGPGEVRQGSFSPAFCMLGFGGSAVGITIGKRMIDQLADVLEQPYESVEDAAKAALEEAFRIYESKAAWAVAGQLYYGPGLGYVDSEDAKDHRVIVGPFTTRKQAETACASLWTSSATGEEFKRWIVPMWHGSPATYYKHRQTEAKKAAGKDDNKVGEQLRQKRIAFFDANPGALTLPEDFGLDDDTEYCGGCGRPLD